MIAGTSKMLSKSGPVDLLTIAKTLQTIQEKYGNILDKYDFPYLDFLELRKNHKVGPTEPQHILTFVEEYPPTKLGVS